MKAIHWITLTLILGLAACKGDYTPKPHGFPHISFPEKQYVEYNSNCPYTFDYPVYAEVVPDSGRFTEPCWVNIHFKPFDATLFISYKRFGKLSELDTIVNDSYEMAFRHDIKADDIRDIPIRNRYGSTGVLYEIDGMTATALQFYLHDSTHNYFRGALYFNSKINQDSVAPVLKFMRKDIDVLIGSLRWKN